MSERLFRLLGPSRSEDTDTCGKGRLWRKVEEAYRRSERNQTGPRDILRKSRQRH